MKPSARRQAWLFGAFFVLGLTVYAPRACRTLTLAGDSAELVSAAALWGVPHPPGYPLYTLVTHLFSRLGFFEFPFSVHLTSALLHAVALGFVACTIELLTGSVAAATIGATVLLFGRVFFLASLYAEVFPLNDAFFAALVWLGVHAALGESTRRAPRWRTLATVLGFAMAHHPMIVLACPALAILIARDLPAHVRERPLRALELAGLALLPAAAMYALVPLAAARHPYVSWGDVSDLASLWDLVTRADYGGPLHPSRGDAEGQLLERLDLLAAATFTSFGAVASGLATAGAWVTCRRAPRVGVALIVAAVVSGPVFAAANAFDIHSPYRVAFFERFTSMCHVPIAVLAGAGAAAVETWIGARFARARTGLTWALFAASVGPLAPGALRLDMSRDRRGLAYAHDLLLSTPEDAVILLKGDASSQAALYVCGVERRCGARIVLAPGQLFMHWKRRQVERRYPELQLPPEGVSASKVHFLVERYVAERPVFVQEELMAHALAEARAAVPSGLLFRIYPNDAAARADLPAIREGLRAVASGEGCEGCFDAAPRAQSLDAELARAYEAALRAQVAAARELGLGVEADALLARTHL